MPAARSEAMARWGVAPTPVVVETPELGFSSAGLLQ